MNRNRDQSPGSGLPQATAGEPSAHRPWGWIAACAVMVLVAAGLALWALSLNSDLDQQRDETAKAQQQAAHAQQQADGLSSQVEDLTQGVNEAADELAQAGSDAKENAAGALADLESKLSEPAAT